MTGKGKMVLLLALSVGVFGKLAVAQSAVGDDQVPQVQYAVFHPDQSNAGVQLAADHDRERCENDRDCRWRWKERHDRYPSSTANNGYYGNNGNYGNNGYYGNNGNNGYYGNHGGWYGNTANNNGRWATRNGQNGWYDRNGNFHPQGSNGYYDSSGRWHRDGWWR